MHLPATAPTERRPVALMYHALGRGEVPHGQDPHYTLDESSMLEQLRQIASLGGACSTRDWLSGEQRCPVLLTFDDGHVSNHRLAFPALCAHGMRADFFVNPSNVGKPGFATWAELREMSAAGMSIQSHGYEHVYLTRFEPRTLRDQLYAARLAIEDEVGAAVTLLAPPGGRMPADLAMHARECGYRHVLSSRPGRFPAMPDAFVLPRLSVTAALDADRFRAWIAGSTAAILRERLRYGTLSLAKSLLGDARYERARTVALVGRRG